MDNVSQNVGVRRGGGDGCFFFDVRTAALEGCFLGVTVLPLDLELRLGGDLGLLTGI